MHLIDAGEIFGMTFYTVDKILDSGGKHGPDALALYYKYIKQSRMQGTNQTYSLNEFMKGGLSRGDDRLKNAKKVLNKLGLIEDITKRDELGKIIGHYIKVNCIVSNKKAENSVITDSLSTSGFCQPVATPRTGQTDVNALRNINNKCLNEYNKNTSEELSEKLSEELIQANACNTSIPKQENNTIGVGKGDVNNLYTFENIYNQFYRKTGHKVDMKKFKKAFDDMNYSDEELEKVLIDEKIFKLEYRYGVKDYKYRPKFDTYISSINPQELNIEQRLYNIAKLHRNNIDNGEDIEKTKERTKIIKDTLGDDLYKIYLEQFKRYGKQKSHIVLHLN